MPGPVGEPDPVQKHGEVSEAGRHHCPEAIFACP